MRPEAAGNYQGHPSGNHSNSHGNQTGLGSQTGPGSQTGQESSPMPSQRGGMHRPPLDVAHQPATHARNRPVHEIRIGRIVAAIWENYVNQGTDVRHSVTMIKKYNQDNQWKETHSLMRDDLLMAAKVLDLCHSWIVFNSSQNSASQNSASQNSASQNSASQNSASQSSLSQANQASNGITRSDNRFQS